MAEVKKVKTLLVDDHKVVRDGIRFILSNSKILDFEVEDAENGLEAVEKAKSGKYDIVVMDIKMPVMDGIDATKEIMKVNGEAKILALSMFNEDFYIREMLREGAKGYILKNSDSKEVFNAITALLDGKNYYSQEVTSKLFEQLEAIAKGGVSNVSHGMRIKKSKQPFGLTDLEVEVLKMIANEYTSDEIAEQLNVSKRTIESRRKNIMYKLRAKNTAGMIRIAMENELI